MSWLFTVISCHLMFFLFFSVFLHVFCKKIQDVFVGSVEIMEIICEFDQFDPSASKRRPGGRGTYAQPGEHETRRFGDL